MKADPHIYESELPMIEGETYTAKCGLEVAFAQSVLMWDAMEFGVTREFVKMLRCCRKCKQIMMDEDPLMREHYIYGIRRGKQEEEEAA